MSAVMETPQVVVPPQDRMTAASARLLVGMAAHGVLAALLLLCGILAGLGAEFVLPAVMPWLMFRWVGALDAAWLTALLVVSGGAVLLLLVYVGVLAREQWVWAMVGLTCAAAVLMLALWGSLPAVLTLAAALWGVHPLLRSAVLRLNPMMMKEIRERMRGGRSFAVMTVYLLLLSTFAVVLFATNAPITRGLSTSVTGDLGRITFAGVVGLEMALLMFIAPAFTAGSVTGERERKTYDLLRLTLLSPSTFLVGKLQSALGFMALLLLAAIPLQSIAFLFGGVSEVELLLSLVLMGVTALTFSAVGIFFSARTERTASASLRAYAVALGVLFGVPVAAGVLGGPFYAVLNGAGTGITASPVWEGALIYLGALVNSLSPFTAAVTSQSLLVTQGQAGLWTATLNSTGGTIPLVSPWVSFCVIYLAGAGLLVLAAIRRAREV